ncbi:MAG TPA: hypothetical protein VNO14_05265 [Blastocatellia bacterium]|nr:hypothetical protein [Blastocatellia bacterium]
MKRLLIATLAILFAAIAARGQQPASTEQPRPAIPALDDITITPSRLELVMLPGTEKTVVVNLIYSSVTGKAEPTRVIAYLGDWNISREGKIRFYPPGTLPNSACAWMFYSPVEELIMPGRTHSIRVTISVPKDAAPGDHLAALFVEPRVDNLKTIQNQKQVRMKFRLAAIFYVMVPELTRKGSLEGLRAEAGPGGVTVIPRLKNEGNSHIRPVSSVKLIDSAGVVVAEVTGIESLPVLAGSEIEAPIQVERSFPEGDYLLRYRVDLGGTVTEGQTELVVKQRAAESAGQASAKTEKNRKD